MSRAVFLYRKVAFKAREAWIRALSPRTGGDPSALLAAHVTPAQESALAGADPDALAGSIPPPPLKGPGALRLLVVVPFRDRWDLTGNALASLERQAPFAEFALAGAVRVVLVDNGSVEEATEKGVAAYLRKPAYRHLRVDEPFNFSRLNNLAVRSATDFAPTVLLFLNNDVEFTLQRQLSRLVGFALDEPSAGAVGCTLLYPDGRVQHLFLAPGLKIVGGHPARRAPWDAVRAWRSHPWPVPAVTGAALCVKATSFEAVGGFDEALATAYQDLDLCLKLQKAGFVNWSLPDVTLVHHETATRKAAHSSTEVALMYARWGESLTRNPYFSTALSRWSESPALARGEGEYPWREYLLLDRARGGQAHVAGG